MSEPMEPVGNQSGDWYGERPKGLKETLGRSDSRTSTGTTTEPFQSPTTLYVAEDQNGQILYVGISGRPNKRMAQHRRRSGWWPLCANLRMKHFRTRGEAEAVELQMIAEHKPVFNVVGNPDARPPARYYGPWPDWDEILWHHASREEPRLLKLESAVKAIMDDGSVFCANAWWSLRFKRWLSAYVGWSRGAPRWLDRATEAKGAQNDFLVVGAGDIDLWQPPDEWLATSKAYDICQKHLYRLLPDCRGCWCL